jgi:hypothetical protein
MNLFKKVKSIAESGAALSPDYNTETYWSMNIKNSIEMRTRYSKIQRWEDIEGYYNHDFEVGDPVYNMIYMFGRALIPNLVFRNPVIINTPRFPKHIPFASIMDSIDEWLMQEMEVEDTIRNAALHAYLYNMGAVETGWDFPDIDAIHGAKNEEEKLRAAFAANMGLLDTTTVGSTDRARRQNFPWFDSIYPRKLLFEPTTRNLRTCRWYAKSLFVPTRVLMADKGLKNVSSTHVPTELQDSSMRDIFEQIGGIEPYTHFYEVHNAEDRKMFWMSSGGKFMFEPVEDPMQLDGLPLDALIFNQNPLSIWGTPDALYVEPQMLEGNETRRQALKQRRFSMLKILVDQEILDEEEIEKLAMNDVAIVRAKGGVPGKPLRDSVVPFQPHTQQEFYPYQEKLNEDAQKILGFGNNQMGTFAPGRRTKYEAQVVQQSNEIRIVERRHMVARLITNLFRKTNQALLRYWKEPMVLRVIGVEGAYHWVKAKPQDIKAELDLKVDVESMVPPSKDKQKEDLLALMQVLQNSKDANMIPIMRKLVSKFPEVNEREVFPQAVQDGPESAEQFNAQQQKMIGDGSGQQQASEAATRFLNAAG